MNGKKATLKNRVYAGRRKKDSQRDRKKTASTIKELDAIKQNTQGTKKYSWKSNYWVKDFIHLF